MSKKIKTQSKVDSSQEPFKVEAFQKFEISKVQQKTVVGGSGAQARRR